MLLEEQLRRKIVEIGRRLYERELIVAMEGNISARLDDRIIMTPAGTCKGMLSPNDLVIIDIEGRKLSGARRPSTESPMHLEIYRQRRDVAAVVHAHPPFASAYAIAGIPLNKALVAEIVVALGCIPVAEYGAPSTEELPASIRPYVSQYDALLLSNHGAVTYGPDLDDAYFKMETVEHFAKINLLLKILGRERTLTQQDVEKLIALRSGYGVKAPDLRAQGCPVVVERGGEDDEITLTRSQLIELLEEVIRRTLSGSTPPLAK